jgi:hypothetical protein
VRLSRLSRCSVIEMCSRVCVQAWTRRLWRFEKFYWDDTSDPKRSNHNTQALDFCVTRNNDWHKVFDMNSSSYKLILGVSLTSTSSR